MTGPTRILGALLALALVGLLSFEAQAGIDLLLLTKPKSVIPANAIVNASGAYVVNASGAYVVHE